MHNITLKTIKMKKARVLFVSSEITPYVPENHISHIGRYLPQGIQERGKEIRTFMPRYGCINERRNQLHEVIRLSGMNLIINDADHPLIIKVASIQAARMQVYFIDNEEFFQRKSIVTNDKGEFFEDNDERAIFFCRGVLETVKKLGWAPDVIHCHGWMTSVMPLLVKKVYNEEPIFANSRVVYSVYNDEFDKAFPKNFGQKVSMEGVGKDDIKFLKDPSFLNVTKMAIQHSDGVIMGDEKINTDVAKHLKSLDKPVLAYKTPEEYLDSYNEFYDMILEEANAMV